MPVRPARIPRLLMLLALALVGLSGCIVNTAPSRGILEIQWQPAATSCAAAGISTVRLEVTQGGALYREITGVPCDALHYSLTVPEGVYNVTVYGRAPDGGVVAQSATVTLTALAGFTQASGILTLGTSGAGAIAVAWTVQGEGALQGCAKQGIQTVVASVIDETKTKVLQTASATCSAGQVTVAGVPPGARYLQLDGFKPTDPNNAPSFGNPKVDGPIQVFAGTTTALQSPIDLKPLGAPQPTVGGIDVAWTVFGKAASSQCAASGISQVTVRVLNQQKADLASVTVACTAGVAVVQNVPAGSVYVQLDVPGVGSGGLGNVNLAGPFQIVGGQTAIVQNSIDIAQRNVISLDWLFKDGGTCGSHNTNLIYVEVRDGADKVIVPMKDPFAAKPCDLTPAASYDARVIDMAYANPICAIPPGAKGLVVCNVTGSQIGITLSAATPQGAITYGGSMKVKSDLPGHTALPIALELLPCGPGNPCTQP